MKLYTWIKKLKGNYFGVVKELWGQVQLSWIDWVLQLPNLLTPTQDAIKEETDAVRLGNWLNL